MRNGTTLLQMRWIATGLLGLLAVLLLPAFAEAQCASWNQGTNTIEQPVGTVIGVANLTDNRAYDLNGTPLTASGITCVIGSQDGLTYDSDDLSGPEEEEEEEGQIPELCGLLPCEPGQTPDGNPGGNPSGNPGGNPGGNPNPAAAVSITSPGGGGGGGGSVKTGPQLTADSWNEEVADDGKRNKRTMMISNNFSQQFEGVHATPVIIDPRKIENASYNLLPHDKAIETGGKRPTLGKVFNIESHTQLPEPNDLGVDDEVVKTAMALYQPYHRMAKDFLEDKNARDDYLDSALTLRGVTVMAMGFLDKTLGAGLIALQEQQDNNVQLHLLKQIGWTTNRMANPDRSAVFRDVDEKLEHCLEHAIAKEHAKASMPLQNNEGTRKYVWYEGCSPECGDAPPASPKYRPEKRNSGTGGGGGGAGKARAGNGSYAYCVCCAETAETLNAISDKGGRAKAVSVDNADAKSFYTLAERAFYGVNEKSDSAQDKLLQTFKTFYGDITVEPKASSSYGGSAPKNMSVRYQIPKASPQKLVALYKNRCQHSEQIDAMILTHPAPSPGCDLNEVSDFDVKYGVCPALGQIFEQWENIVRGSPPSDFEKLWSEGSMGHPLDGNDIREFLSLHGDPQKSIPRDKINLVLLRVLESFCRSSAVAALTRVHSTNKAYFLDQIALSQKLTPQEKGQLSMLVDRFSHYLALAEADVSSKFLAEATMAGMSIEFDRWKTAHLGASTQSAVAMAARSSNNSNTSSFLGGVTSLASIGGGAGGGGAVSRTVATFRENFGDTAAEQIAVVERQRAQLDPVTVVARRLRGEGAP
ncbi:MAG: hypothetical protein KDD69_00420 [Bdellovibrionales bacterium]|nr:hypothetical protein [Bdellovibrionales bacterium]